MKKRAAVEPADQSASDINTTSHEQALNLLADLSRNVPVNQRKDQTDGSTAEGLSNAQSIGAAEHAGTTRAPFKVQQQTAERPYLIGQPTISPYQNSAALPGANHSAEVPFQQGKST